MFDFIDSYPYLLPVIIFVGRIFDVTLGTLRIIFVSKGEKLKAPIIGFFEVFIWVVIISQILSRANDMVAYLSYAGGYAAGNYVGILIEKRIAFGIILCRVYTNKAGIKLVRLLSLKGFGATLLRGTGSVEEVDIIETVIDRKQLKLVSDIIMSFDKDAFYVIEDVRTRSKGIFPKSSNLLRRWRQGK
ncbi:MAG: DUF5698 domain-containing protein [Dysgonamonadaceae bacterium]|nr:DUF5698 domain-containing protein [Dysgonamonadaceae bacterium]MDD4728373.1 DUF5698 domain-containing protein [Dysgonamonadaceae bacterium]